MRILARELSSAWWRRRGEVCRPDGAQFARQLHNTHILFVVVSAVCAGAAGWVAAHNAVRLLQEAVDLLHIISSIHHRRPSLLLQANVEKRRDVRHDPAGCAMRWRSVAYGRVGPVKYSWCGTRLALSARFGDGSFRACITILASDASTRASSLHGRMLSQTSPTSNPQTSFCEQPSSRCTLLAECTDFFSACPPPRPVCRSSARSSGSTPPLSAHKAAHSPCSVHILAAMYERKSSASTQIC